jgi:hypothetical protein
VSDYDIYRSDLAKSQLARDARDCRRSLYTNTKPDHEPNHSTGGPCNCERGDTAWENGVAMRVRWPPQQPERAPEASRPQRSRGRSR